MLRRAAAMVALILASCALAHAEGLQVLADGGSGRMFGVRVTPAARPASSVRRTAPLQRADLASAASEFVQANAALLGLADPARELIAAEPETDALGLSRVKYFQTWQGLEVFGGELNVHLDRDGQVTYVKTKVARDLPAGVTPVFTREQAEHAAINVAMGKAYGATLTVAHAKLLVLPLGIVRNEPSSQTHLAWEVRLLDADTQGDHFAEDAYYDAITGERLLELSGMRHYTAVTRQVYDCAGGASANTCQLDTADPTYPTYFHGRTEGQPARGPFPNPSYPAYFGSNNIDSLYALAGALHTYYSTTFGIDGPNGHGGTADWPNVPWNITRALGHADTGGGGSGTAANCPGSGWFNDVTGSIYFCLGMAVPDIVGHEYAHAFIHHGYHDSGGFPIGDIYSGQTASLDEGSADFMGEVFQSWHEEQPTDWTMGSGGNSPWPIRSMAEPHSTVRYGGDFLPYPDHFFDATFYCGSADSYGAHYNMTVPAHAFYLIAMGGTRNYCTIAPQGIEVAQQIVFRGWRTYFSRSVTFNEAYTDLIQASIDLYGDGPTTAEVRKALQAVEMDQPGKCSGIPEVLPACNLLAVDGARPTTAGIQLLSPNPARGSVHFGWSASHAGQTEARIHDVAGRVLARPVSAYTLAGEQLGVWDGRDANGTRVVPGCYFLSVTLDGQGVGGKKLLIVR